MNWLYNGFIEIALNAYCHINQQICGYRLVLYIKLRWSLKRAHPNELARWTNAKLSVNTRITIIQYAMNWPVRSFVRLFPLSITLDALYLFCYAFNCKTEPKILNNNNWQSIVMNKCWTIVCAAFMLFCTHRNPFWNLEWVSYFKI